VIVQLIPPLGDGPHIGAPHPALADRGKKTVAASNTARAKHRTLTSLGGEKGSSGRGSYASLNFPLRAGHWTRSFAALGFPRCAFIDTT
jgi:hypothetical protein